MSSFIFNKFSAIIRQKIRLVQVIDATHLMLDFDNGEKKLFDVSPYMDKGIFTELRDYSYFKQVHVSDGTIVWPNEQDFCPDTLYLKSEASTAELTKITK